MANDDSVLTITLSAEQLEAARQRAAKAGFDSTQAWAQELVEADLRRAELESQVSNAIEQGDFQQLAADLRDKLRVAPKPKAGKP
jgi:cyclopropane fatty-acyl-phospholipid synthase-like methyltransferase